MGDDNPYLVPCACEEGEEDGEAPFCGDKKYVSDEERAVLAVMRKLKDESRALRDQLEQLRGEPGERQKLQARLDDLRRQFKEQQTELELATEQKMRQLGHIP